MLSGLDIAVDNSLLVRLMNRRANLFPGCSTPNRAATLVLSKYVSERTAVEILLTSKQQLIARLSKAEVVTPPHFG